MTRAFPFTYQGVRRYQLLLDWGLLHLTSNTSNQAWNRDRNPAQKNYLPFHHHLVYVQERTRQHKSKPSYSWLFQGKRAHTGHQAPDSELCWPHRTPGTELWQELRQHSHSPKVTKVTVLSLNLAASSLGRRHNSQINQGVPQSTEPTQTPVQCPRHQCSTGTCWQCPAQWCPAQNQGKLSKPGENAIHKWESSYKTLGWCSRKKYNGGDTAVWLTRLYKQ